MGGERFNNFSKTELMARYISQILCHSHNMHPVSRVQFPQDLRLFSGRNMDVNLCCPFPLDPRHLHVLF